MRLKLKPKPPKPERFSRRTISKFAWIPIKINREIRWLEKVTVMQMYDGYWENLVFLANDINDEE